ncbi:MAG: protein-export chaperone SecB [Rhodospirillaceae bacterium]|nr:protein-export chaperone SecB [Rhodospirillaceae bacterium]
MSDENAAPEKPLSLDGTDAGGAPMMIVNAQYVKDLSFENPNAPQSLNQQGGEPNVQIAIDVNADQIADKSFEVSLTLRAEGTSGTDALFIVEIVYAGIFTLGEVPDEYVPPMLYIEAPRQLFPFARAIVADNAHITPAHTQRAQIANYVSRSAQHGLFVRDAQHRDGSFG